MIVVSEIGEIWSPQTAPERTAATETVISDRFFCPVKSPMTSGTMMANVPQLVPDEKDMKTAMANESTGMK